MQVKCGRMERGFQLEEEEGKEKRKVRYVWQKGGSWEMEKGRDSEITEREKEEMERLEKNWRINGKWSALNERKLGRREEEVR